MALRWIRSDVWVGKRFWSSENRDEWIWCGHDYWILMTRSMVHIKCGFVFHVCIDGGQFRLLFQQAKYIQPGEVRLTCKTGINLADKLQVCRGIHRPAQGAIIWGVVEQGNPEATRGPASLDVPA